VAAEPVHARELVPRNVSSILLPLLLGKCAYNAQPRQECTTMPKQWSSMHMTSSIASSTIHWVPLDALLLLICPQECAMFTARVFSPVAVPTCNWVVLLWCRVAHNQSAAVKGGCRQAHVPYRPRQAQVADPWTA